MQAESLALGTVFRLLGHLPLCPWWRLHGAVQRHDTQFSWFVVCFSSVATAKSFLLWICIDPTHVISPLQTLRVTPAWEKEKQTMDVHGWEEAGGQQEWEGKSGRSVSLIRIHYVHVWNCRQFTNGGIKFLQLLFVCHHVPLLFYLDKQKVTWYDGRSVHCCSEPVREHQLNVSLYESCHGQLSQTVFVTLVW